MSIREIMINIICFVSGLIMGVFSLAIVSAGTMRERDDDEFK